MAALSPAYALFRTAFSATVAETVTIGWQEKLFSAPEIER